MCMLCREHRAKEYKTQAEEWKELREEEEARETREGPDNYTVYLETEEEIMKAQQIIYSNGAKLLSIMWLYPTFIPTTKGIMKVPGAYMVEYECIEDLSMQIKVATGTRAI